VSVANILLTIDVEDWFQVENFKQCVPSSSWSSCELRVEKNTHRLLDLFDSFGSTAQSQRATGHKHQEKLLSPNAASGFPASQPPSFPASQPSSISKVHCTFFILGWLAERLPNLVREIHFRGHEVASHGFHHELCCKQSLGDLKQDLVDSKKLLEDITGAPVYGYRAPSFSINDDILKLVEECGYRYDSSYNSFGLQGRYGKLNLPCSGSNQIAIAINPIDPTDPTDFYELPISNLSPKDAISYQLSAISSRRNDKKKPSDRFVLPWGGGGYFRLIPFLLFKKGVQLILKMNGAYLFYMHPWEIDPDQPKVSAANRSYRFRHYVNLDKTFSRLERILNCFNSCRFITCSDYLNLRMDPATSRESTPAVL
jgi:polysaccharide deacetylase family protein (PEP-CTERM system associated)